MKANLPTSEPETLARWNAMDLYGKLREARAGRAEIRPARRPALRQRQHSHRHCAQQDPQRARRQIASRCPDTTRPTSSGFDCHGLPIELKVDKELGPKKREMSVGRFLPRVPRVCRALHRHDDRTVPAPGHSRHVGSAVPDDGFSLSGGHRANVRPVCRKGAGLQGQEAGALVHPLPHGARRGRGRIRRSRFAVDLRRVSAGARKPGRAGVARSRPARAATCRSSSGRRRPGRFRRISRSRFTRSSTTPRTMSTDARSSWPKRWPRVWPKRPDSRWAPRSPG